MNDEPFPDRQTRAELLCRTAAGLLVALGGFGPVVRGALASAAPAAPVVVVSRDEPLGARGLATTARARFNLVGLHWQGPGDVWFRVRRTPGGWTAWQQAVTHELPDPGSGEGIAGWRLGTPVWTGEARDLDIRTAGRVDAVRSHLVWSPPFALRRLAAAVMPTIVTRAEWGADESIVKGSTLYADRLVLSIVHHTAGKTPATPDESAQVVRAIQAYHVESNGWNDIGYNALVDPFGQVFEGRRGGIDRNVVGAHALGFNTGSVGVALLGSYQKKAASPEAHTALETFLAWRLDVAHVDPTASVTYVSGGSPSTLRAISGHRDVNATECPGAKLYPDLDDVAAKAALLGLPKLYEPAVSVEGGDQVRFSARLSEPLAWSVVVSDANGAEVVRGQGDGPWVSWVWDATAAPAGSYRYSIEGGSDLLPATGSFQLGSPVAPPESPKPPEPPPTRPSDIPRRIPRWAWELERWHLTPKPERGTRPASAPRHVPRWYWSWFSWLRKRDRWKASGGR